jgi:hypothetical protein
MAFAQWIWAMGFHDPLIFRTEILFFLWTVPLVYLNTTYASMQNNEFYLPIDILGYIFALNIAFLIIPFINNLFLIILGGLYFLMAITIWKTKKW